MKLPAWLKTLARFFGWEHPIRCSKCRRPLRGKSAKLGIGPKCWREMDRVAKEIIRKEEEKQTAPV